MSFISVDLITCDNLITLTVYQFSTIKRFCFLTAGICFCCNIWLSLGLHLGFRLWLRLWLRLLAAAEVGAAEPGEGAPLHLQAGPAHEEQVACRVLSRSQYTLTAGYKTTELTGTQQAKQQVIGRSTF